MDLSPEWLPQLQLGRVSRSLGTEGSLERMFPMDTSWVIGLLEDPLWPITALLQREGPGSIPY